MLRACAHQHPQPAKKLGTDSAAVVFCECNNCPKKTVDVWKSTGKQKKKEIRAGRLTRSDVQYPSSSSEKVKEVVETPAKKTDKKKPGEPYQYILASPETGEISLFKSRN